MIVVLRPNFRVGNFEREALMSDFWDYRGWERSEEKLDWQDIHSDNLEFRANALYNRALHTGLESDDNLEKSISYLSAAADINRQLQRLPELLQCLLHLGDCYLKRQRGADVAEVAIEAQSVALQCLDDKARATALHLQGYNSYLNGDFDTAGELSFNAAQIHESAGELSASADMYLAATRIFRWSYNLDRAIDAAENSLRVAKLNNSLEEILQAKSWHLFLLLRGERRIAVADADSQIKDFLDQMKFARVPGSTARRLDLARAWNLADDLAVESLRYSSFLLEYARENKNTNDAAEAMFAQATAWQKSGDSAKQLDALRSIFAVIADIASTVSVLEVAEPLANIHFENGEFLEAEQVWAKARTMLEAKKADSRQITFCDQMIALCIAEYADPARALGALEGSLPRQNEQPLPYKFEYALAKSYAANERPTESILVIDRALANVSAENNLEFAELHELKCDLLAKQGNLVAARTEAQVSFEAYLELDDYERAKRLKVQYLSAKPGDADPATGAITLGDWG